MGKLADKTAVVTGSVRGIGKAIAELFAADGANVVVTYLHSESRAMETLAALQSFDGKHLAVRADVSRPGDVDRLFDTAMEQCHGIDILVNNAGINRDAPLSLMTEEMWDEVLATNLKGTFLCCKAAAARMRQSGSGNIINIASETALAGRTGGCNYVASKAGVIALTKCLAKELAPNIRVNCLAPGDTETEELKERRGLSDETNLKRITQQIPLGRIGSPPEIAKAVLFLATNDSSFMTGQTVVVGGGRWT